MKNIILVIALFISGVAFGQFEKLRYNKLFDGYYRMNIKGFSEVGGTYLAGDLGKNPFGLSFGTGVSARVLPPLEVVSSARYFTMNSTDHNAERNMDFCGKYTSFNLMGRYYLSYDKVRTNEDRKKAHKLFNFYLTSGLSISHYYANPSRYGFHYSTRSYAISKTKTNVPLGFGLPIRYSENTSIVPEFIGYYTFTDEIDGIFSMTDVRDHYGMFFVRIEHNLLAKPTPKKPRFRKTNTSSDSETLTEPTDENTEK